MKLEFESKILQIFFLIGIAAISLDGCITKHEVEGTAFTSNEDKEYFHKTLKYFDSSIFGRKTFAESKEHLLRNLTEKRLKIVLTSDPSKFSEYSQPGRLEFKSGKIEEIIKELEDKSVIYSLELDYRPTHHILFNRYSGLFINPEDHFGNK